MADLDISGSVTRAHLGLSDLALNTSTYKIMGEGFGPGVIEMENMSVSSPYIHGSFLMQSKKAQVESMLGIRVTGSGYADCLNKMGALCRAFEQISYTLTIEIEGTSFVYECDPASYAMGDGGIFQAFHIRAYKQEVKFLIPRRPVPTEGPV